MKKVSVIVTIVDAGEALNRCLLGLRRQIGAPELEVIVPYDDSVTGIDALRQEYPEFRFLNLGLVATQLPRESAGGQHELYDRRRSAGLAQASGDLVALLEDRGVPLSNWTRVMEEKHRAPYLVIGGAIENVTDDVLSWAAYFCDFGRYQRPFVEGPAKYVSDINVSYKSKALGLTRQLWKDRFHETEVHWELRRRGALLYLTPDLVIEHHRESLRLWPLLAERIAWGRLFAHTRSRQLSRGRCWVYAALTPLLPAVLFIRQTWGRARKRVSIRQFLAASPVILLLLIAWSWGELVGYLRRQP